MNHTDPKKYYHFSSTEFAISDIENRRIKVSLIDDLNDPFELLPYLRFSNSEKRNSYHKLRKLVSEKYGLLCFSNNWHEPLLWSHYADKHKGVVLGFEISEDKYKITEVTYNPTPLRQQVKLTGKTKNDESLVLALAGIKYKNWAYENEYRVIVKLKDCIQSDGRYFVEFGKRLKLAEIVLGAKCSKDKNYILDLAKKSKINVIATRLEWQGYKIKKCGTRTEAVQKLMKFR